MAAKGKSWSPEEDDALQMYYPHYGARWDGWKCWLDGRTAPAIIARANVLGIKLTPEARARAIAGRAANNGGRWSDEETRLVEVYYPEYGASWDGWKRLLPNRTRMSISQKARHIGIGSRNKSRKIGKLFSKKESAYIFKVVIKLADILDAEPYDVALEMIRLGNEYEKERQEQHGDEQSFDIGEPD